jgi:hypothetical protein
VVIAPFEGRGRSHVAFSGKEDARINRATIRSVFIKEMQAGDIFFAAGALSPNVEFLYLTSSSHSEFPLREVRFQQVILPKVGRLEIQRERLSKPGGWSACDGQL